MPSLPTSSFLPPRRGKVKKDVKDRITAMSGSVSLHKSGRSCGMVLVSRRRGAIEGTFLVLSLLSLLLSLSPPFLNARNKLWFREGNSNYGAESRERLSPSTIV